MLCAPPITSLSLASADSRHVTSHRAVQGIRVRVAKTRVEMDGWLGWMVIFLLRGGTQVRKAMINYIYLLRVGVHPVGHAGLSYLYT